MIVVFEHGGGDQHPPVEKQVPLGGGPVTVEGEQGLHDLVPVAAPRSLASGWGCLLLLLPQVAPLLMLLLLLTVWVGVAVPSPPRLLLLGWRGLGRGRLSSLDSSCWSYCCRCRRRRPYLLLADIAAACFAAVGQSLPVDIFLLLVPAAVAELLGLLRQRGR